MKLTIATCQFPTSADCGRNLRYVLRHMDRAKEQGADVVHLPEACLSGYAGHDFVSYAGFNWSRLEKSTARVLTLAADLGIWVLLGSTHRLTAKNKPHDSVYIVSNQGELVDRYDKRFCAGDRLGKTGDLLHYSPGNHFSVFTIRGIRCGILLCHEYRYPELYREYKRLGVQLVFHSYHAAHINRKQFLEMQDQVGLRFHRLNRGTTLPAITMPASMQAAAASNHVWISCSNSSARESCWGSFFVRPDGVVTGQLRRNAAGILVSEVDDHEEFYDSTIAWRDSAMRGVYHSGRLVRDRRSRDRTQL